MAKKTSIISLLTSVGSFESKSMIHLHLITIKIGYPNKKNIIEHLLFGAKEKQIVVQLYWTGCLPLSIHKRDPTTAEHEVFDLLAYSRLSRFNLP